MHHHIPGPEEEGIGEKKPETRGETGHFESTRRKTLEYGRDLWCVELQEELRPILYFMDDNWRNGAFQKYTMATCKSTMGLMGS